MTDLRQSFLDFIADRSAGTWLEHADFHADGDTLTITLPPRSASWLRARYGRALAEWLKTENLKRSKIHELSESEKP